LFNPSREFKNVPIFSDKEVERFFPNFELLARKCSWPEDSWPVLVQFALRGKAREVFLALDPTQQEEYNVVKGAILRAYELVPEAYRQKFRSLKKLSEQTYVEFARLKERTFGRWLTSMDTGENFGKLRELILVEEFKKCLPADISTHLNEHKVYTLNEAATMADEYALTHKVNFVKQDFHPQNPSYHNKPGQNKPVHNDEGKPKPDSWGKGRGSGLTQSSNQGGVRNNCPYLNKTCSHCGKMGHEISRCWILHGKPVQVKGSPISTAVIEVVDSETQSEIGDNEQVFLLHV
jgi:hypothetical protein